MHFQIHQRMHNQLHFTQVNQSPLVFSLLPGTASILMNLKKKAAEDNIFHVITIETAENPT